MEWMASIASRSNGSGCPKCAGKVVGEWNSLSSQRPDLVEEWNLRNTISPENITVFSSRKVWWICGEGHEWKSTVANRSAGNGCPFCGRKVVTAETCLLSVFPDIAKEWHPRNNGSPRDVFPKSSKSVWWICKNGHEWKSRIYNRSNGTGCPFCYRGISRKSQEWLDDVGIPMENREVIIKTANGRSLKVDGVDWESNTVYEYYGTVWHGDPRVCDPNDQNPMTGVRYGDLYKRTMKREKDLIDSGFSVVSMWEIDGKS